MVLIILGSLGFSFLPTPSFLFLHSSVCQMDVDVAVPVPPGSPLQALACPAFPSLSVRYWVCKDRDCQPGQDGKQDRRHHAAKCPKLFVTQMTGDPNHAAPIPDLALGTPMSHGPERNECLQVVKKAFCYYFDKINIRKSFFKGRTVKNWIRLPINQQWLSHHPSKYLKAI